MSQLRNGSWRILFGKDENVQIEKSFAEIVKQKVAFKQKFDSCKNNGFKD